MILMILFVKNNPLPDKVLGRSGQSSVSSLPGILSRMSPLDRSQDRSGPVSGTAGTQLGSGNLPRNDQLRNYQSDNNNNQESSDRAGLRGAAARLVLDDY